MTNKVSFTQNKVACVDPVDVGYMFLIDYKETACAKAMGCKSGIARNKLNPDTETNQLSFQNVIDLTEKFNDDRMLTAWAASRGKALYDLPEGCASDDELTDQVLELAEKFGELSFELKEAREDGVIDHDERQKFKNKVLELVSAAMKLDAEVESQVREMPSTKAPASITKITA